MRAKVSVRTLCPALYSDEDTLHIVQTSQWSTGAWVVWRDGKAINLPTPGALRELHLRKIIASRNKPPFCSVGYIWPNLTGWEKKSNLTALNEIILHFCCDGLFDKFLSCCYIIGEEKKMKTSLCQLPYDGTAVYQTKCAPGEASSATTSSSLMLRRHTSCLSLESAADWMQPTDSQPHWSQV